MCWRITWHKFWFERKHLELYLSLKIKAKIVWHIYFVKTYRKLAIKESYKMSKLSEILIYSHIHLFQYSYSEDCMTFVLNSELCFESFTDHSCGESSQINGVSYGTLLYTQLPMLGKNVITTSFLLTCWLEEQKDHLPKRRNNGH